MSAKNFVIRVTNGSKVTFYETDRGGYPYFTAGVGKHLSFEEADNILYEMLKPNDANGYPNNILHRASEVNNANPTATISVEIVELVYKTINTTNISVQIKANNLKKIRETALAKLSDDERRALGL